MKYDQTTKRRILLCPDPEEDQEAAALAAALTEALEAATEAASVAEALAAALAAPISEDHTDLIITVITAVGTTDIITATAEEAALADFSECLWLPL